jgi:hypothetical protein
MICVPYADSNIFESAKFWVAHGEFCKFLKNLGQEMFMYSHGELISLNESIFLLNCTEELCSMFLPLESTK